jgi:hypothetical protein
MERTGEQYSVNNEFMGLLMKILALMRILLCLVLLWAIELGHAQCPFARLIAVKPITAPAGIPFITGVSGGTPRNNFTGDAGMWFTTGASAMTVTDLGIWVISGNSGTHTINLYKIPGGCVLTATASINLSGATAGTWKYFTLASPAALLANTSYALVVSQTSGGDQWLDQDCTVTCTAAGSVTGQSLGTCSQGGSPNKPYSAPNFKYTIP